MNPKVGATDFTKMVLIGEGGYGKVFLVRKNGGTDHGRLYALKQVQKTMEMKRMEKFLTERNILERVRGQAFLATIHYAFETERDLNVVLDFVNGGDLFTQTLQLRRFSERRTQFYISELVLALENLHKLNIVHRDIKPENILIDSRGHVVLTDFGVSKIVSCDEMQQWDTSGSVLYLAPEVIQRTQDPKHRYAVDWWALGVLTFELLMGYSPFASGRHERSTKEIFRSIVSKTPVFPSTLSIEAEDFLISLLQKDPKKRLGVNGAIEVKMHPFFKGIDWPALKQQKVPVPFLPRLKSDMDTSHFSEEFTKRPLVEAEDLKTGLRPLDHRSSSSTVYSASKLFRGFSFVGSPLLDTVRTHPPSDVTGILSARLCRPKSSATSHPECDSSLRLAGTTGCSQSDIRRSLTLSTVSSTPLSPMSSAEDNLTTSKAESTAGKCHKRLRSSKSTKESRCSILYYNIDTTHTFMDRMGLGTQSAKRPRVGNSFPEKLLAFLREVHK